jgi:hypothetical protein
MGWSRGLHIGRMYILDTSVWGRILYIYSVKVRLNSSYPSFVPRQCMLLSSWYIQIKKDSVKE